MARKQNLKGPNGRVAIVAGLRSPFARMGSVYRDLNAIELAQMVVTEMLARTSLPVGEIEQVVFGQVIQNPAAPNIAREIVLGTSMSEHTDAYSVSRACATSFQSTANVAESIMAGNIDIGIAGGADSSSAVPITISKKFAATLRDAQKARSAGERMKLFAALRPKDLIPVAPAIAEYSTGQSMGQSAEQMAKDHGIAREAQDQVAHLSHVNATKAWAEGKLADEVMTAYPRGARGPVEDDNLIRKNSDRESYAKLKPVFDRKHGTVTAANSSPLTDGAAALLLMSEKTAKAMGYKPLGFLRSYAFTARTPKRDLLMGPSFATPLALDRAGLKLADLDLIDMHEAFAAQILCNTQAFASREWAATHLNRSTAIGEINPAKFNVLGGSIAYGHPFAATGARMITQTLNELKRRGGGLGLTTACAAGGLGAAMILEAE